MLKTLKNILFSTRLMAVLFLAFGIAMGSGTFIETKYNIETARIWIYNAWWFELIILLFAINFIGNIKRYRLQKRENWAVLVLHLSWIFIILGAFITRYISSEGTMSIREGEGQDFYVSERTYITTFVDGEFEGQGLRKSNQQEVLFSEYTNNHFDWSDNFKGKPFEVSLVRFIRGVEEGFIADENGKLHLKIVEAGGGSRHEHWLEEGTVGNFHNILFAFNKPTEGAINITINDEGSFINTPFAGTYMRMADQKQGEVIADTVQPLQFRSLYNFAGMQFVLPELPVKGKQGIVEIPREEVTKESLCAAVIQITSGNQTKEVTAIGTKGLINPPASVNVNGLDFHVSYGSKRNPLPFKIQLNDFVADKYPGTEKSYSSFMSKITVIGEETFDYDIYMNHILNHEGFRFFQASFHPDEKGTVLSVNHDYWGTFFTYIGYFLLYGGLIAAMFLGKTRFVLLGKKLKELQKKKAKMVGLALLLISCGISSAQNHQVNTLTNSEIDSILKSTIVSKEHASKFGELIIQDDDGRMKPINTFASELLRKMSKKDEFQGMNADQALLSMMLSPSAWYHVKFMYVKKANDSLHKVLGVTKGEKYVSALDFFDEKMNYKLSPYLQEAYATSTPNQFQKEYKEADQRLGLLNRALSGDIFKVFPLLDSHNNKWISTIEYRQNPNIIQDSLYANFVNRSVPLYLEMLRNSIKSGDYTDADNLLEAFKKNQQNHSSDILPTEKEIKAELLYNKYDVFKKLFSWYLYVGLFMFTILIFAIFYQNKTINTLIKISVILVFFLFGLHTLGLAFRWYISGHAPWSNAYESMIYVAWATMTMGLYFIKRSKLTVASTTFVTSMILMIAHWNWMDPAIGTLQPVLNSYWLMIHVAVIVGSYGPFTLGMILGIVSMFLMIFTTKKNKSRMSLAIRELTIVNELSLTVGLVMLTIGNFLGAQWANESWGRYWGWDPKETWALVSIMVYAFVIHMRIVPKLKGRWLFNFISVVAYSSIMMTYFGVNFYLSGLHSYASGDKIITPSFVYYSVAAVFLLGAVSYWRYRKFYKK